MPDISLFESDAASRIAIFDQIKSLQITLHLRKPSTFRMEVPTQVPNYEMLTRGRYIGVSDVATDTITRLLRIDQLERSTDADSVIITGRDFAGWFDFRLCFPPAGQAHHSFTNAKAETVIKALVTQNAGPTAPAVPRRLPNFVIEADQARGQTITVQARYQTLSEMLEEVLNFDGGGYEVAYDAGPTNQHVFRYIDPTDRSASVFLDLDFESVSSQSWLESDMDMRNMLYVAGQGEGVNRIITGVYQGGAAPSGLDRKEAFVDARDISDTNALTARGVALLEAMGIDHRHNAVLYERGSFRYGTHFFLGDIVTVQNRKWGLDVQSRVISVTLNWQDTDQPTVAVELDRPWPNIKERIMQGANGISSVAAKGAVDYHAENHASRHAPAGADPLSPATIGAATAAHSHTNIPNALTVQGQFRAERAAADGAALAEIRAIDTDISRPVDLMFHQPGFHFSRLRVFNNVFSFREGPGTNLTPIDASDVRMNGVTVAAGNHSHSAPVITSYGCYVRSSVNFSVVTGDWRNVPFDTQVEESNPPGNDGNEMWTSGTNHIIYLRKAGRWLIIAGGTWAGTSSARLFGRIITTGGTQIARTAAPGSDDPGMNLSVTWRNTSTSEGVSFQVYQNSGATRTLMADSYSPFLQAIYLGA